jgi:hypothetical protein
LIYHARYLSVVLPNFLQVADKNTPWRVDVLSRFRLYDEVQDISNLNNKEYHLMLTTIIVILLILWLLGYFGPGIYSGIPATGNVIHTLLVIALILIVLRALGIV